VTKLHLYVTSTCHRCRAVERWLDDHDISFTETNMDELPAAEADEVRTRLKADGYTQAPAVYFVDDESGLQLSFTGFDVGQLEIIHAHLASKVNNS
jgi:glutaredoxin